MVPEQGADCVWRCRIMRDVADRADLPGVVPAGTGPGFVACQAVSLVGRRIAGGIAGRVVAKVVREVVRAT